MSIPRQTTLFPRPKAAPKQKVRTFEIDNSIAANLIVSHPQLYGTDGALVEWARRVLDGERTVGEMMRAASSREEQNRIGKLLQAQDEALEMALEREQGKAAKG